MKVTLGFSAALGILLVIGTISFRTTSGLVENSRQVNHSYAVRGQLASVVRGIAEAESGARGYALTARPDQIGSYEKAWRETDSGLVSLFHLTQDNPAQQRRVKTLDSLVRVRIGLLGKQIRRRGNPRSFDSAATAGLVNRGRAVMDEIRRSVGVIETEEEDLLRQRTLTAEQSATRALSIIVVGSLLAVLLVGLSWVIIGRDVAARLKVEMDERDARMLLSSIIEGIPAMLFMKDARDLRFIRFNKAGEELLGFSREELIGKNDYDFFPKEEADFFRAKDREVLAGNRIVDIPEEPVQTRFQGIRFLHTRKISLQDEEGRPRYLLGISEDITDRKQAAEALRLSEERFSKAFRASPAGIVVMRLADGRIIDANDTFLRMMGYRREEAVGHTTLELGVASVGEHARFAEAMQRDGSVRDAELRTTAKSGERLDLLFSMEKIELGAESCTLAVVHDMTERKRAEERIRTLNRQLETANKELEAFSYSVSHDLRAPLRSINGFSQLLLETYDASLDDAGKDLLRRVRSASLNMAQLIDDLLNLSRLSRVEMVRGRVDLSAIAHAVIEELCGTEPARAAAVHFSAEEGLTVTGDARLLRVVMENLLGNAWKYTQKVEHPVIEFGSLRQQQPSGGGEMTTAYFVRDNGAGFDMAYAGKLFGAFQRLHSAAEFEGTGIGLAIVARIIHRHGGKVWAEGQVGGGATFFFSL